MLRDLVAENYLKKDYNCAETMLLCINERYGLGLTAEEVKLASAFGAGLGCGNTCGALCSALAGLGRLIVDGRAHATPGFGDACKGLVEAFEARFGSTLCRDIAAVHKKPEVRCIEAVQLAADLFEEYYEGLKK